MSERRDDLQEIIGKALEGMAAEGFDPQACDLADFCRRTGLTRSRARTIKGHGLRVLPHGNTGRKAGTTVLTGHTGLVDDLLGKGAADSQVIYGRLVGQGCRGGLTSVKVYVAAHMDLVPARGGAVAPRGSRGQRFVTGPGQACQTGRGLVTVVGLDGAERKMACLAMVCRHCGSPHVGLFPNARRGSLPMGMVLRPHGHGDPRRGARGQHEVRRGQARPRRQASLAARLRGVHGVRRPPHQAPRAATPPHQGQGRAADQVREGRPPRGRGLRRHHRPRRGRGPVVRGAGREVAARRRLRAGGGARGRLPRLRPRARGDRGGRALALPPQGDDPRRLRQLRGPQARRAAVVRAPRLPREPRGQVPAHIRRRPLPRARRPRRHLGPAGLLVRGPAADAQPEELPSRPVTTSIAQAEPSPGKPAFAKSDFGRWA